MDTHAFLLDAFRTIPDKEALAWSILDTKSEAAIVRAIATTINRKHGRRALVEYPPRVDLVVLRETHPSTPELAYEAKAAYLTDFQPHRLSIDDHDWYLGPCVDDDLTKLQGLPKRYPAVQVAAVFFLYELSAPTRQLKYGKNPLIPLEKATTALQRGVKLGALSGTPTSIDCGTIDGTSVRIHMYIFDPR